MCSKTTTFIQIKIPGEPKSRVKPLHSMKPEDVQGGKRLEIPCGKCASCQIAYANKWANRCSLEAKQYKNNHFITLTYDNEHLPTTRIDDKMTGEVKYTHSINKQHLKKFIKSVRNYYYREFKWTGIKFFACGEYGGKKGRPHYHLIMFNLPIYDAKHKFNNKKGEEYYTSKIIDKCWKKGISIITEYSWNTGEYIARYISKRTKDYWNPNYYRNNQLTKEFITMSNGIGRKYLEQNMQKILDNDRVMIKKKDKVIYTATFKYYLRLLEEKYGQEERVQQIKDKREQDTKEKIYQMEQEGITQATHKSNKKYYDEQYINKHIRSYEHETRHKD